MTGDEMRDLARLRRSTTDRHVAGVAGGLGRHLDIDPVIIRVAFVVLTFFGGAGLLAYGALWLMVPEDDSDHATFDLDARTRNVALVGVGVLAALLTLGDVWGGPGWFPWPLVAIGLIAWLLISNRDRRRARRTGTPRAYGPPAAGYVPPAPRRGDVRLGRQHRHPDRAFTGARRARPRRTPPGTPDRRPRRARCARATPARPGRSCSGSPSR